MKTPLCTQLGLTYPIFCAGMATIAGPGLASAVSNAGGCGVLGGGAQRAFNLRDQIRRLRTMTDKPFGVNLILPLLEDGQLEACLEEGVPIMTLFWGDPEPYVKEAHRRGVKVFVQVGSVEEGVAAAKAGVDAIIAQGIEAGGHVKSTTGLSTIVPAIVDAVEPLPVIASGGIADGRGIIAALNLGAQAVSIGTRFLCSVEAEASDDYKRRVVASTAEDTLYTSLFDIGWPDAPHRVLRNKATQEWEAAGCPVSGRRPGEKTIVATIEMAGNTIRVPRYGVFPPITRYSGDIEYMAMYAGESCSLVNDIKPAAEIVRMLMREAEETVERMKLS